MHFHIIDRCEGEDRTFRRLFTAKRDIRVTASTDIGEFQRKRDKLTGLYSVIIDAERSGSTALASDLNNIREQTGVGVVVTAPRWFIGSGFGHVISNAPVLSREGLDFHSLMEACMRANQFSAADLLGYEELTKERPSIYQRLLKSVNMAVDRDRSSIIGLMNSATDQSENVETCRLLRRVMEADPGVEAQDTLIQAGKFYRDMSLISQRLAKRHSITAGWMFSTSSFMTDISEVRLKHGLMLLIRGALLSARLGSVCRITSVLRHAPDTGRFIIKREEPARHGGVSDPIACAACFCFGLRLLGLDLDDLECVYEPDGQTVGEFAVNIPMRPLRDLDI